MPSSSTVLFLFFLGCSSAPVDEPIRVDLPVYDSPHAGSDIQLAQPIEPESHASMADRSDKSIVGNIISHKLQAATNVLGHKLASNKQSGAVNYGYFSPPIQTYEGAILETEGLGSKSISFKDNIHHIMSGLFQPRPIVDTINEDEKYGNHGDKFYNAGRAIVGGAENVSNLVNSVLEVPGSIFRKITRAATEKLNNLGGKLIGL